MYGDNTHTPDSNISDVTRKAFRILEQKYPWRETKHREKIFYVLVHIFECCIGICNAKSIKLLQKIFPHLDAFYRTMIHNSKLLVTIREGVKKSNFFLGKSPKLRTSPTHRRGLGLT